MIKAGELRHRVELQKDTGTDRNAHGHKARKWVTQKVVWAKIEQLSGNQALVASQQFGQVTTKITTRFDRTLKPDTTWRFLWNDRELYIADVNNVEGKNEEWIFICGALSNG